jgi:dephospho-CoA kinase
MAAATSTVVGIRPGSDPSQSVSIPAIEDRNAEELILAVVGPVGSGSTRVADTFAATLRDEYGYDVSRYRLSDIIRSSAPLLGEQPAIATDGAKRIEDLQSAGNRLRKQFGKEYLAAKVIEQIARWREQFGIAKSPGGQSVPSRKRHVHIIDSLKNPAELKLLRQTYGDIFWLIGVFAPIEVRRRRLTDQMGLGANELNSIILNDYSEREDYGQSVRDTFFQADLFVRNDQPNDVKLKEIVRRSVWVRVPISSGRRSNHKYGRRGDRTGQE